jgi:predicted transcriptional regulator
MKSVLISIKPKYCELIASGEKTVEVRKTRPKLETPFKVYIYCTQGTLAELGIIGQTMYEKRMKVIGEFVCDKIETLTERDLFEGMDEISNSQIEEYSCVDIDRLLQYKGKKSEIYGWHISDLVIYDKPRELSEFKRVCDGNCQECKYAIWETNGWYHEPKIVDCKPITRPFQSWGYVEDTE